MELLKKQIKVEKLLMGGMAIKSKTGWQNLIYLVQVSFVGDATKNSILKKKKLEKANHTSSQAPRPKIAKFTTIPIYRFNIFAPNWDINPCTGVTSSKYSDGLFEIFGRNVVRPSDTLITFGF